MQQGYGTRSLIEKYKEKRRKEKNPQKKEKRVDEPGIRKYGISK